MFCKKCGREIEDGAEFCQFCGKKTAVSQPMKTEAEEMSCNGEARIFAENTAKAEAEMQTASTDPAFAGGETFKQPPKKKMKLWLKLLLFIGVPLLIIAILAVSNFDYITGLALKAFAPDIYMARVENAAFRDCIDAIAPSYSSMLKNTDSTKSTPDTVDTKIDLCGLVDGESLGIADEELSWLKNLRVKYSASESEDSTGTETVIYIGDTPVMTVKEIYDRESGSRYLSVPEIGGDYVRAYETEEIGAAGRQDEFLEDLVDAMPDAEVLTSLAEKYSAMLMSGIKDVQASKGTVTVNGEDIKCTELRLEMDNKTVGALMEEILTEVKKDEDIKKILDDLAECLTDASALTGEYADADEVYKSFIEYADELLAKARDMQSGDEKDDICLVITDYVDARHNLIAKRIEDSDGEFVFAAKAEKKDGFLYEFSVSDDVRVRADVINENNTDITTFIVEENNTVVFTGEITCTDAKTAEESKKASFKLKIKCENEPSIIYDNNDEYIADFTVLAGKSIELTCDADREGVEVCVAVMDGKDTVIKVSVASSTEDASVDTAVPGKYQYYDPQSDHRDAIIGWFNSLDISPLTENLQKAGLSDEVTIYLEYYLLYQLEYYVFGEDYIYFVDDDTDYDDDYYYDDDGYYYYDDDGYYYDKDDGYYYDEDDYSYGDDYICESGRMICNA